MKNATNRNRKKIAELIDECQNLISEKRIKNARKAFALLQRKRKTDKPFKTKYRERTQSDCDKRYIASLQRFIDAANAPALDYISFSVEWKKSRTWGWCPRSHVEVNGVLCSYYSSGCGYDKLSHSIYNALPAAIWTRFCIEKWNKIKGCYGFNDKYWLPDFDFAGCGISTLENMLRAAGWKSCGYDCRRINRQGDFLGAYYAMR